MGGDFDRDLLRLLTSAGWSIARQGNGRSVLAHGDDAVGEIGRALLVEGEQVGRGRGGGVLDFRAVAVSQRLLDDTVHIRDVDVDLFRDGALPPNKMLGPSGEARRGGRDGAWQGRARPGVARSGVASPGTAHQARGGGGRPPPLSRAAFRERD